MGCACCCASHDANLKGKDAKGNILKNQDAGGLDVDILYGNKNPNPANPPLDQMLLIQYLKGCTAPGPTMKGKDVDNGEVEIVDKKHKKKDKKKDKKNKSKSREKNPLQERPDRRCEAVTNAVTKMIQITWERREVRSHITF